MFSIRSLASRQFSRTRRAAPTARRSRLSFDTLEQRDVPTAGISFDAATGLITVEGDTHADKVQVSVDANATTATVTLSQLTYNPIAGKSSWKVVDSETVPYLSSLKVQFNAHEGNDTLLNASAIPVTAFGGLGNDTLEGGSGADHLYGEAGADTIKGNGGDDTLKGFGLFTSGADAANAVHGGAGNDLIYGGAYADKLYGDAGNDTVLAYAGNDTVLGGTGNDTLRGGVGSDKLYGQSGADVLKGEAGADCLDGGADADRLYGGAAADSLLGGTGKDVLVSIGGGIDSLHGGTSLVSEDNAPDSFWRDPSDSIWNLEPAEQKQGEVFRTHTVSKFYTSYFFGGADYDSVSLELNGQEIHDPMATSSGYTLENFSEKDLFGPAGPQWSDIVQGSVGDCYFLAKLAAAAKANPAFIRELVVDLGDGTYAVRFYNEAGKAEYVRVDADFYVNSAGKPVYAKFGPQDCLWVAVVEKAWAFYRNDNAWYQAIDGGNAPGISIFTALGLDYTHGKAEKYASGAAYLQAMQTALAAGKGVWMGGPSGLTDDTPMTPDNYRRGAHIYYVHSVVTDRAGAAVGLKLYNLYGGPLVTITDLDVLHYCSGSFAYFNF